MKVPKKPYPFFYLFFSLTLIWYVSSNYIIPLNYYVGMHDLNFDISFIFSLLFLFFFMLLIFNLKFNSSTDYFLTVIFFLCIFNSNIFYSVSGITNLSLIMIKNSIFLIFFLTFIILKEFISKINFQIPKNLIGIFKLKIEFVITILLSLILILVSQRLIFSFDDLGNYNSRIIGRENISGFLGYLWNGGSNGLAPILSFLSIYNKRYIYFIIAIAFALTGYVFIAIKLPFILVLFMGYLGWFFSNNNINFFRLFYLSFFYMSLISFFEYLFFDYSYIGDYLIRRFFLVISQNQMYFINFIYTNLSDLEILIFGPTLDKSESLIIGYTYYHNEFTNANSNTFFSEIIRNGLVGFFLNLIFLIFLLSFFNYCFRITKHHVWYAIPILYAVLISEQNYKTAFLSSGILFIIILLIFFKHQKYKYYND